VAAAENGAIGRDNKLLFRLRSDLKRFRALTMGKPMLMGRKTWDSIGKPLPGRETIVLTRDPAFRPEGALVAHSLPEALDLCAARAEAMGAEAIMVVGGAAIYAETLPLAQRLHLTQIHATPEADAFFPDWDRAAFRETLREDHPAGPDDEAAFTFIDYERR
jgi:dihydrofolate reductase